MPKKKSAEQFATVPYRPSDGGIEILLVTSRETSRWVIPKGWPMKGKSPKAAAAKEALQEAGVAGRSGRKTLGRYSYDKRLKNGELLPCQVRVFTLLVDRVDEKWKEDAERSRRWFTPSEAADAVGEPELKTMLLDMQLRLETSSAGAAKRRR